MKSLLRFSLMLSLVVIGKINQQASSSVAAASKNSVQLPVQRASFFQQSTAVKQKLSGGGSRFWQSTAPTVITASNLE
jgi:hypothetical protein